MSSTNPRHRLACALAVFALLGASPTARAAGPNLVQNGSFETGAFTSWTEIGNNAFDGVHCPGASFVTNGNCDAYFGPLGGLGGIQQAIASTAGAQYLVTFDFLGDPGNTSSFQVAFGNTTLLNLVNPLNSRFQTYSLLTTASSASSMLTFQFRDDAGLMELDNVSVTAAVPEPAAWMSLGLGLALVAAVRRRTQART